MTDPESKRVSIIVAMSENGVIGRAGGLPWHLSSDLRRFKRLTMGHALIMGRKTFESIGRPLPGRRSIVITRQPNYDASDVIVAHSLASALTRAEEAHEVFVIGGADIFRMALPHADRLYLTLVHAHVAGDVYFPTIDWHAWKVIAEEAAAADERDEYKHTFRIHQRIHGDVGN